MKVAFLLFASVFAQTWQNVTITAPPESCCTGSWETSCDVIFWALHTAKDYTQFELTPGIYCNANYTTKHSALEDYTHGPIASLWSHHHIKLTAKDSGNPPKLMFDGSGAIVIGNSNDITIKGLEIIGSALAITGDEATKNRQRRTGRDEGGCLQHNQQSCWSVIGCEWDRSLQSCIGVEHDYYDGAGIFVTNSANINIDMNTVHHCPGSGIFCNKCDNTTISYNKVYGNTWWTTRAPSGIVFSDSEGDGHNIIANNVVYGNRNFMPLYITVEPAHGGSGMPDYGKWNQTYIIDGQGICLTRQPDYKGTFTIQYNTAFDNGINGLVVQKTTNSDVKITIQYNKIFDNGRTSREYEHRQNAGGVVINSGGDYFTSRQELIDNTVSSNPHPDQTYQCYGNCILDDYSTGNTWCGGKYSEAFPDSAFTTADCDTQNELLSHYRKYNPDSQMPLCPQYTPFVDIEGYNCTEPTTELVFT